MRCSRWNLLTENRTLNWEAVFGFCWCVSHVRSCTFTWTAFMLLNLYSQKSEFQKHNVFRVFCLHVYLFRVHLTAVTSSDWPYVCNRMLGLHMNSELDGMWNVVSVTKLRVVLWQLRGMCEDNHEIVNEDRRYPGWDLNAIPQNWQE